MIGLWERRRGLILAGLAAVAAVALFATLGDRWARTQAIAATDLTASRTARSHASLLASELQKFRLLPVVLAEYPDVGAALATHGAAPIARLNRTLELLAARTDSAAIYLIDRDGLTIAASNWRLATSFVGSNYGFRPYFRDAMARGQSELFALGTVSGRPGLYLARRLDISGRPAGTIVVKVEFDRVESIWARAAGPSFVTDAQGVILITAVPGWRFRATRPLDAATLARVRETLQFGGAAPKPAAVDLSGPLAQIGGGDRATYYRAATEPVPLADGRLVHLEPLAGPLAAATSNVRLWGLGLLVVVVAAGALVLRDREKRQLAVEAQRTLEAEVVRRTAELQAANEALHIESRERADADRRFRAAREELAQANRLGSLGQITAGVAHEINQPVAAIRTFAENAGLLLDRAQPQRAYDNLHRIIELTSRIGSITAELRNFARRKVPAIDAVPIGSVIDGSLMILGERARHITAIELPRALADTLVIGDRVRLEQILINLLQNALEAIAGNADPAISLTVAAIDDRAITVTIADNGPGVDPSIADALFTPFVSAKPAGIGLGLAIARDIAREFGGELTLTPSPLGGAAFTLLLKRS
ncbi:MULTISPECIES: sensor histidine kinase [Sphingomonas]|uniref:sensor histidine kinase n=1 Tax=Sphingomonas TaxID=13687 RepID=UPI00082FD014|nr:ATP-binding protein [Sphingomonas sp. CCH10-B3]